MDEKEMMEKFKKMAEMRQAQLLEEFSQIPLVYEDADILPEDVMVPLSDGVRLKTYIFRPKNADTIPTLFKRSCYPYGFESDTLIAREFAKRGLACVLQYCRGTGGSEGEWEPNFHERPDGIDAINWLADQPWVESIGYFGESYLALTGWAMIDMVPEKVKGMYLGVYGTNRHVSAYKDGLFRQDILTAWAMGNAGAPITADYMESCSFMPQIRVDRDLWGMDLPWYRDLISHTDFSDDYWQTGFWNVLRGNPAKVKIPIVFEEGWYDHHLGSALSGYRTMKDSGLDQCLFRVGAWKHGKEPALYGHEYEHLENNQIIHIYRFFEKILLKKEQPQTGVSLYMIGEDRWLNESSWPLPDETKEFYFDTKNKTLHRAACGSEDEQITFTYDPKNPLPSYGSESCFRSAEAIGSLKQPEPDYRSDVISFISEPLAEDMTIIGQINADIYVSSDAEDTSFSMKVMEVFENGEAYNIRSGITTLAYRNHSDTRQTYTPNTVEKINIDTWDITWTAKKGSRIRVDISSSDFPQYSVHSNYPGVWSLQNKCKTAQQTIYSGTKYPSVLRIPVCKK